jgi:hypothetical protein
MVRSESDPDEDAKDDVEDRVARTPEKHVDLP